MVLLFLFFDRCFTAIKHAFHIQKNLMISIFFNREKPFHWLPRSTYGPV